MVETPLSAESPEIPDPLVIERSYDALPAAVFAAWSDPQLFKQWVWASLGKNTQGEIDFQVSGQYSITTDRPEKEQDDSRDRWAFSGTYTEIKTNELIAATMKWDAPMGYGEPQEDFTVTFESTTPADAAHPQSFTRTKMTFTHFGIPDTQSIEGHRAGWSQAFDYLEHLLEV